MQPPPRKSNYVKFLKTLHAEQIAKLQAKNQHECDLLEDIRTYTIKRSAIERSYAEALLKISSAFINKKAPNIPDIKVDGAEEKWNMWNVWRTVLEENEKLARARLAAVEVFQQQIADEAKHLRQHKLNVAKKCTETLAQAQKEVQLTVQDIDKYKKQYFDEEHTAHDVRDKAKDIEEKLRKKKGSFFQSITSLQKNSAKVSSRRDQLEEKSTGARNDYLLSIASANAHQNRYFLVELQSCMQIMEAAVYDKVAEFLTLMGRTELLTCSAMQHSFGKIRDQAQQLARDYNLQCLYLYYPVLKQHIRYEFEACDNDPVEIVTMEHETVAAMLAQESRRWATRVVRETALVRDAIKKIQLYQGMRDAGQKVDPADPNGSELEVKIDELRSNIRRSETSKAKYEAKLEFLKISGAPVDEWLKELDLLAVQESLPRSSSLLSIRTDLSGAADQPSSDSFYDSDNTEGEATPAPQPANTTRVRTTSGASEKEHDDEDDDVEENQIRIEEVASGWDDPTQVSWGEAEATTTAVTADVNQAAPLYKCTALYSYTAQNPDELSIIENEQLEVVGEGDGDGWLRARNYRGEEGYVPHNYLDVERDHDQNTSTPGLVTQISFSSVDYTVEGEDAEIMPSPDQISVILAPSSKEEEQNERNDSKSAADIEPTLGYCFALYDYDSENADELNLEEGQIIRIVSRDAHGVDDGWWRGEANELIGNFPSLIVEECDENGEPLSGGEDWSPPPSAAPALGSPTNSYSPAHNEQYNCEQKPLVQNSDDSDMRGLNSLKVNLDVIVPESTLVVIGDNNNSKEAPPKSSPPSPPAELLELMELQRNFNLELSRNQQDHYGKQFDDSQSPPSTSPPTGPPPFIEIVVDEDDEDVIEEQEKEEITPVIIPPQNKQARPTPKHIQRAADSNELGVAQIVITAATPMMEEAELAFGAEEGALEEEEESLSEEHTAVSVREEAAATNSSSAESSEPPTAPHSPPQQQAPRAGRASIPDELEPEQLARLSDLKESNA